MERRQIERDRIEAKGKGRVGGRGGEETDREGRDRNER